MIELPGGTILGPYETREEWLEARKLGIGGSDIGALLGLSQFKSPLQVFYEKTEGATQEVNEAMEIGAAIEPWIRQQWIASGAGVRVHDMVYSDLVTIQSQTIPFLLHSPDAPRARVCSLTRASTASKRKSLGPASAGVAATTLSTTAPITAR